MDSLFIFVMFSSFSVSLALWFFAIYKFSVNGDVSFFVMFFALIFLFLSFYGALGFTDYWLKTMDIDVRII